jgi:hypothetical protein
MAEQAPPGPVVGEIWAMLEESQRRHRERQGRSPRFRFLSDERDVVSLALEPKDLTALENLAREAATRAYPDASLSAFTLAIRPFAQPHDVGACLFTYSTEFGRTRLTLRVDPYGIVEPAAASEDAQALPERPFAAYPWDTDSGWREAVRQAYAQLESLGASEYSVYYVSTSARFPGRWEAIFQDGKSGREAVFEWTSAGGLSRRK